MKDFIRVCRIEQTRVKSNFEHVLYTIFIFLNKVYGKVATILKINCLKTVFDDFMFFS
jgi:hypothetical protein